MGGRTDRQRCRPLTNAARERSRVQSLRTAFSELQRSLPSVPPDTKLAKLDVLVLATAYICNLTRTLGIGKKGKEESNDTADKQEVESVVSKDTAAVVKPNPPMLTSAHFEEQRKPRRELDNFGASSCIGKAFSSIGHMSGLESKTPGQQIIMMKSPSTDVTKQERCCECNGTALGIRSDFIRPTDTPSNAFKFKEHRFSSPYAYEKSNVDQALVQAKPHNCCRTLETRIISTPRRAVYFMRPVKKWPMRCRFYQHIFGRGPS